MAQIIRSAKYSLIEDLINGRKTLTSPVITSATMSKINLDDDRSLKIGGFTSTRNEGDTSMYIPVATTSGYERGVKICYAPVTNDGGYFDALFVNTKIASTSTTANTVRAIEAKTTVEGNMAASAIATGLYAKVNVSGASAEVSQAYGIHVLLEEESSGTITAGTGVYVEGGDGAIDYAVDISGDYRKAALKLPELAGAAITAATIASAGAPAQGALAGDTGFVGLYKDSADSNAVSAVFKYAGLYYHVKLTDTTDS